MKEIVSLLDEAWKEALEHYKCSRVASPLYEAARRLKEKGNSLILDFLEDDNINTFPFYAPILYVFNSILNHPFPNDKHVAVMIKGLPSCLEDLPSRQRYEENRVYLKYPYEPDVEMSEQEALQYIQECYTIANGIKENHD